MRKIRYAVVGAGWIAQEAFMPGVSQTGNSTITAIVSGSAKNAAKLAEFHGVEHVFSYEQYDQMLARTSPMRSTWHCRTPCMPTMRSEP